MLNNSTVRNARSAPFKPESGTFQRCSENTPAATPKAANQRLGCGPVSPQAMGRGGSSSAATKKQEIQRGGSSSVQMLSGNRTKGTASASFSWSVGATATPAAHAPNSNGAR